jgi:hypothetical protein
MRANSGQQKAAAQARANVESAAASVQRKFFQATAHERGPFGKPQPWASVWDAWKHIRDDYPDVPAGPEPIGEAAAEMDSQAAHKARKLLTSLGLPFDKTIDTPLFHRLKDLARMELIFNREGPTPQEHAAALPSATEAWFKARHVELARQGYQDQANALLTMPEWAKKSMVSLMYGRVEELDDVPEILRPHFQQAFPEQMASMLGKQIGVVGRHYTPEDPIETSQKNFKEFVRRSVFVNRLASAGLKPSSLDHLNFIPEDEENIQLPGGGIMTLADYSPLLQDLAESFAPNDQGGVAQRLTAQQVRVKTATQRSELEELAIAEANEPEIAGVPVSYVTRKSLQNFFGIVGAPFAFGAKQVRNADEALEAGVFDNMEEGFDLYKGGVAHWLNQAGVAEAPLEYWKNSYARRLDMLRSGFTKEEAEAEQHDMLRSGNTIVKLMKEGFQKELELVSNMPDWFPLKAPVMAFVVGLDEIVTGTLAQTDGDENTAMLIAGAGAGWFRRAAKTGALPKQAPKLAGLGEAWRALEMRAGELVNPKGLRAWRRLEKVVKDVSPDAEVQAQMLRDVSADIVGRLDRRVQATLSEGRTLSPDAIDIARARPIYRAAAALEQVSRDITKAGEMPSGPMSRGRFALGTLAREAPVELWRGLDASGFLAQEMVRGTVPAAGLAQARGNMASQIRRVLGGEALPDGPGPRPSIWQHAEAIGKRAAETIEVRETYRSLIKAKRRDIFAWRDELKVQRQVAQRRLQQLQRREQLGLTPDHIAPDRIKAHMQKLGEDLRNIDRQFGELTKQDRRLGFEMERVSNSNMLRDGFRLADDVAEMVMEPEILQQMRRTSRRLERAVQRAGHEKTAAKAAQTLRKALDFDGADDVLVRSLDEATSMARRYEVQAAIGDALPDVNNLVSGSIPGTHTIQRIRALAGRIKAGMRQAHGQRALVDGVAKRFDALAKRAKRDPVANKQLNLARKILGEKGFDPVRMRRKADALAQLPEFADLAVDMADQAKNMAIRLLEVQSEIVDGAVKAGRFTKQHARELKSTWHPHLFEALDRTRAKGGGKAAFGMDPEVFRAQRRFGKARVVYKAGDRVIAREFGTLAEARKWTRQSMTKSQRKGAQILEPLNKADIQNWDMVTDSLVARLERARTLVDETAQSRILNTVSGLGDLVMTAERAAKVLGGAEAWTSTLNKVSTWVEMPDLPSKFGALAGKIVHRNVVNSLNAWGKFNGVLEGFRRAITETTEGSSSLAAVTTRPIVRGMEAITGSKVGNAAVGLAREARTWGLSSWILTNPKVWGANIVFNMWSMAQSGLHPGILLSPTFWKGVTGLKNIADDADLLEVARHGVDFEVGAVSGEILGEMAARGDWVGRLRSTIEGPRAKKLQLRKTWLQKRIPKETNLRLADQFKLELGDIKAEMSRTIGNNVFTKTSKFLYGNAKKWQRKGFQAYSMIDAGMKAGAAKYMLSKGIAPSEVAWRIRTFWQNYGEISPMVRSMSSGPVGLYFGSSVTSFPVEWMRIAANSMRYRPLLTTSIAAGNLANNIRTLHQHGWTVREWGLVQGYENEWETAFGLASNAVLGFEGDTPITQDLGNMTGLNMLQQPTGLPRVYFDQMAEQFPAPAAMIARAVGGIVGRFTLNTVPLSLATAGIFNLDSFTGQHIHDPGAAPAERAEAMVKFGLKQFVPSVVPGGYTYETATRALDYRTGMIRPADERLLHATLDIDYGHPENGVATLISIARMMKPNSSVSMRGALHGRQEDVNVSLQEAAAQGRDADLTELKAAIMAPKRRKVDGKWQDVAVSEATRRQQFAEFSRYGLVQNFADLPLYGQVNVLRKMRESGLAARTPQVYANLQMVAQWGPLSVEANPDLKFLEAELGVDLLKEPTNRIASNLDVDTLTMALSQFPPRGTAPELELMRTMVEVQLTIASLKDDVRLSLDEAIRMGLEAARRAGQ